MSSTDENEWTIPSDEERERAWRIDEMLRQCAADSARAMNRSCVMHDILDEMIAQQPHSVQQALHLAWAALRITVLFDRKDHDAFGEGMLDLLRLAGCADSSLYWADAFEDTAKHIRELEARGVISWRDAHPATDEPPTAAE